MQIRCNFSLKIQFFIMFGLTFGPDFEIFSQFLEMRLWITSSEKAKNGSEVLRIRCTFSLKIQFFIMFGLTLGPDFEIFSQFLEMRLWISSSASQCLAKKRKTFLWGFVDPMHFSLKIQFFIMFGLTLGPDFEIFSQFQEMRLWITSSAL